MQAHCSQSNPGLDSSAAGPSASPCVACTTFVHSVAETSCGDRSGCGPCMQAYQSRAMRCALHLRFFLCCILTPLVTAPPGLTADSAPPLPGSHFRPPAEWDGQL